MQRSFHDTVFLTANETREAAQKVRIPIIGIGGIGTISDVMDFLVAGTSAVQIGTANFYDPT